MLSTNDLAKLIKSKIIDDKELYLSDLVVNVSRNEHDTHVLKIQISTMYEYVPMNFGLLKKIADACQSEDIRVADQYSSPGCETCDYGSNYVLNLEVKNFRAEISG